MFQGIYRKHLRRVKWAEEWKWRWYTERKDDYKSLNEGCGEPRWTPVRPQAGPSLFWVVVSSSERRECIARVSKGDGERIHQLIGGAFRKRSSYEVWTEGRKATREKTGLRRASHGEGPPSPRSEGERGLTGAGIFSPGIRWPSMTPQKVSCPGFVSPASLSSPAGAPHWPNPTVLVRVLQINETNRMCVCV